MIVEGDIIMFERFRNAIFKIIPPSRRFMDRKFEENEESLRSTMIQETEKIHREILDVAEEFRKSKENDESMMRTVIQETENTHREILDVAEEFRKGNLLYAEMLNQLTDTVKEVNRNQAELRQLLNTQKSKFDVFMKGQEEFVKSINNMNQEILECLNDDLINGQKRIINQQNESMEKLNQIDKNYTENKQKQKSVVDEFRQKINYIKDRGTKDYFYWNENEINKIQSFYEYFEREDFQEIFFNLINGLSIEDKKSIIAIMQRQKMIREKGGKGIDLYTRDEMERIEYMRKYMQSHIFEINDRCYAYDNYFLPVKHFEASVFYFKHGIQDLNKESLNFIKGKDILDVGGYIGDSVLILEQLEPRHIYSFEAITENYNLIQETLRLNKIENCTPVKLALNDKCEKISYCINETMSQEYNDSMSDQYEYEIVQANTLENFCIDYPDMNIGLIKVDIEGAEQKFLKGARKIIERDRPVLLLSIYHNAADFFYIKSIVESWELGYKFKIHKPCDYSISREVLLICEQI